MPTVIHFHGLDRIPRNAMVVEESSADVARAWAQTGTETHTLLVLTQLTPERKIWINPGAVAWWAELQEQPAE